MPENTSTGERCQQLTPKQDRLVSALLAGHTVQAAAKIAGCNEKTAHNWLKLPHVKAARKAALDAVYDQAIATLTAAVDDAVSTLKRNMTSEDTPASTQVRAAQILLEQCIQVRKMSELEEKIAELEALVKS